MSGWSETTLGKVITFQRGFDLPVGERTHSGFPVVASTGVVGYHSQAQVAPPGIVIGRSGSIGGGQFMTDPFWPLNTTLWVKDFHGNDERFCFYLIKNIDFSGFNVGSGVPTLNRNHIHPLPVIVPPLAEQREIASILGALDKKIELNRKASATLEEMARALCRSWFIDFDPVWAKFEGRQPAHMDAATAALFPDSFGADALPLGWQMSTIGEVAEIVGGSTPSTKEDSFWVSGEHAWATPKDLSSLGQAFLFDTERKVTSAGLTKITSGLSPAGTLLLSSRAPIGYLALATMPVAINQGFIAIRETEAISGTEAYFWCAENMDLIHANANGSTFQEISKKNFRPLAYALAPTAIRTAFNDLAGLWFARMKELMDENRTLANLRDMLLPRLMSGELRVGAAREMVEEVA